MPTEKFVDHYKILGLKYGTADNKSIKKAYRKLSLKYHPDRNKAKAAAAKFIELTKSYDLLKDEETRRKFDKAMKAKYASVIRHQKREKRTRDLRDDLLRRERAASQHASVTAPAKKARIQSIQRSNAKLSALYHQETAQDLTAARAKIQASRRGVVVVKWKRKHCPQTEIRLRQRLKLFGEVVQVRMATERCALVFFESQHCAQAAAANTFVGLKVKIPENEREILESYEPPEETESAQTSLHSSALNGASSFAAQAVEEVDLEMQEDDIFARLRRKQGNDS